VTSEHPEPIVVNDKRRIDPETGELREQLPVEEATDEEGTAPAEPLNGREAEHLADLQRVTAEYANYRKRVDRDRVAVLEMAVAGVLEGLLPLLDSVELARQHGDLEGAFKGVGEGLEQLAERQGLERYTEVGDAFDPSVHDALMQAPENPEASVPTVAQVLQPGWRLKGGRVLRHASVAVAEPGKSNETPES
jgi:molecular chaperone GrpE